MSLCQKPRILPLLAKVVGERPICTCTVSLLCAWSLLLSITLFLPVRFLQTGARLSPRAPARIVSGSGRVAGKSGLRTQESMLACNGNLGFGGLIQVRFGLQASGMARPEPSSNKASGMYVCNVCGVTSDETERDPRRHQVWEAVKLRALRGRLLIPNPTVDYCRPVRNS